MSISPKQIADLMAQRRKEKTAPPAAPTAVPDSVPVALFGDEKSPEARHQFSDRVIDLAKRLLETGPKGIADAPPPAAPIMRATTAKERAKK